MTKKSHFRAPLPVASICLKDSFKDRTTRANASVKKSLENFFVCNTHKAINSNCVVFLPLCIAQLNFYISIAIKINLIVICALEDFKNRKQFYQRKYKII